MTGGRVTLLLVALAALPVGGCGADVAYTRAPDGRVEVRLDEYRVLPERIEVRAGRITFVARNTGRLRVLATIECRQCLTRKRDYRWLMAKLQDVAIGLDDLVGVGGPQHN